MAVGQDIQGLLNAISHQDAYLFMNEMAAVHPDEFVRWCREHGIYPVSFTKKEQELEEVLESLVFLIDTTHEVEFTESVSWDDDEECSEIDEGNSLVWKIEKLCAEPDITEECRGELLSGLLGAMPVGPLTEYVCIDEVLVAVSGTSKRCFELLEASDMQKACIAILTKSGDLEQLEQYVRAHADSGHPFEELAWNFEQHGDPEHAMEILFDCLELFDSQSNAPKLLYRMLYDRDDSVGMVRLAHILQRPGMEVYWSLPNEALLKILEEDRDYGLELIKERYFSDRFTGFSELFLPLVTGFPDLQHVAIERAAAVPMQHALVLLQAGKPQASLDVAKHIDFAAAMHLVVRPWWSDNVDSMLASQLLESLAVPFPSWVVYTLTDLLACVVGPASSISYDSVVSVYRLMQKLSRGPLAGYLDWDAFSTKFKLENKRKRKLIGMLGD